VNIPYTYLAVLLVFTLLIGVVIGDQLAAGRGVESDDGIGRSGGCSGLASARLHECVHRFGHLRTAPRKSARSGAATWQEAKRHGDVGCEMPDDYRDDE
jgi:hypothetical protein